VDRTRDDPVAAPLVSMMTDDLLLERYQRYLERLITLSEKEVDRTAREDHRFHDVAKFYVWEFNRIRSVFADRYSSDILRAFRKHRDAGKLEIITCGATHGFFPLMDTVPEAIRAQVQVAANHYAKHFDRRPQGIWLPECGYLPGQERFVSEAGIKFGYAANQIGFGWTNAAYLDLLAGLQARTRKPAASRTHPFAGSLADRAAAASVASR
jgi:predicted glycosyl hydrolase (DUF1957 family)